ncbi:MAG: hypothetical protein A3J80_07335 [Desulfobacula sp. RIFOXYB2_FULL_45_6]|nr:MAG: hypothetical protein A3J80_07335 [Desulfobacula sp. RIFOXYB2_FULL_45_6]
MWASFLSAGSGIQVSGHWLTFFFSYPNVKQFRFCGEGSGIGSCPLEDGSLEGNLNGEEWGDQACLM